MFDLLASIPILPTRGICGTVPQVYNIMLLGFVNFSQQYFSTY